MAMMQIYAGIASVRFVKSIFVMDETMRNPTMTRAGAVAKAGMAMKIGDRNRDRKKRTATVTLVRPVRPPSLTPEALSTKVVTVLVPMREPSTVPQASAMRAP